MKAPLVNGLDLSLLKDSLFKQAEYLTAVHHEVNRRMRIKDRKGPTLMTPTISRCLSHVLGLVTELKDSNYWTLLQKELSRDQKAYWRSLHLKTVNIQEMCTLLGIKKKIDQFPHQYFESVLPYIPEWTTAKAAKLYLINLDKFF